MKKLNKILKNNDYIFPNYKNLNIVDLVRYLYSCYGVKYDVNENMKKLKKIIPSSKHTILVLSDGTGSNIIDKLPDNNILKKNKVSDMITVFPSTTACVLTSLVTGEFPTKHGIWGWYNYYKNKNINYEPLIFSERHSGKSLIDFNINQKEIFISKSRLNDLNCKTNVLFPKIINDSVYSNFVINNGNRFGYENYDEIVDFMNNNCMSANESYTYLYLPDIDDLEHDYGIDSKNVYDKLQQISILIEKLSKINDLTIIFTADHGQTNIHNDILIDFNKYNKYFYSYPTIDFGTASYFVKKEYVEEFVKEFEKEYKDSMYLFKTKEFIDKNMFGIEEFSDYSKNNLGEFISICKNGNCFINSSNLEEYYGKTLGNHSGLSKDEMIIPLIIINKYDIK